MKASPREIRKSNRKTSETSNRGSTFPRPSPGSLWPALVAVGSGFGLAVNHASALELGDISVQSALGQPLRASIAYALAPNESLYNHCIFLRPGNLGSGLPAIKGATTSVSGGVIRLAGTAVVREPLLDVQLTVDCPGTANLSRQYFVFIDPPSVLKVAPERSTAGARRDTPAAIAPVTVRNARRTSRPAQTATPIRNQNQYRVQPGDTLSGIAARIADRDVTIWQAVDRIFSANPDAFIDNNRNLLRAGSLLVLPDLGTVAAADIRRATDTSARSSTTHGSLPAEGVAQALNRDTTSEPPTEVVEQSPAVSSASQTAATTRAQPQGGDPSTVADNPFVSPMEPAQEQTGSERTFGPAKNVIPDTEVEGVAETRPASVRRPVSPSSGDGDGLTSLAWLGGAGIAIILGLLLFGRRFKDRFGSPGEALAPAGPGGQSRNDGDAAESPVESRLEVPGLPADGPIRLQPVTLDADLGTGSGFDDDGEIDVAQDFGFSTSRDLYGELDMELSEEALGDSDQPTTSITAPSRFDDAVIVEESTLPEPTGDYDMSMIVDATRQPIAESEDTTKDLKAIQVDEAAGDAGDTDNYTLSREIDYKILEQDYEDELTATQALSSNALQEAEEAALLEAAELARDADAETVQYAAVSDDLTSQLPGSEDSDRTAEMPLDQDFHAEQPGPVEDSGMHAQITTELPAADNDATLEMDIESTTIDTKKLRAS